MAEVRARGIVSTPEESAFELRAAEASVFTGSRLLIGIATFAYASLAFAYFYLRSSNNENLWRPHGITAPTGLGAAIFAVILGSTLLNAVGVRRLRAGTSLDWIVAAWLGVLGGLIAIGLQVYELTQLPFFPGSSGYASCFVGWASLNIAGIVAGVYWLETTVARAMRLRHAEHEIETATGGPRPSAVMFRANLESCTYYWGYLAVVSLLFWVLFYVV